MDYKVKNDIPQFYCEDDDTEKLLEVIQHGQEIIHDEITKLKHCIDYEKCDEKYLDYLIAETGFTPDIPLTEYRKRKIAKNGKKYLSMRGTDQGIIFCIKDLFNIDIKITNHEENEFTIGFSMFGGDDHFGSLKSEFLHTVIHHETNPELINAIRTITEYLKWEPTTYKLVYQEIL